MKLLFFVGLSFLSSLSFASEQNFNGTYSVTSYTWCNGPSEGPAVGCWPYGWQGVDLGKLTAIKIESLGSISYFTLRDSSGKTWSSNFAICPNGHEPCNAAYSKDLKTLTIKFGDFNNRLEIKIEDNEVSLFPWAGAQSSYLVFEFSKN